MKPDPNSETPATNSGFPATNPSALKANTTARNEYAARAYLEGTKRLLRSLGVPEHDLEDVTQEALIRLICKVVPKYVAGQVNGRFRDYAKEMIRNIFRDEHRAARRRREVPVDMATLADSDELASHDALPEEAETADGDSISLEDADCMDRGVARLQAFLNGVPREHFKRAKVLKLVLVDNKTLETIAEEMKKTSRTIRDYFSESPSVLFDWLKAKFPSEMANANAEAFTEQFKRVSDPKNEARRLALLTFIGGLPDEEPSRDGG